MDIQKISRIVGLDAMYTLYLFDRRVMYGLLAIIVAYSLVSSLFFWTLDWPRILLVFVTSIIGLCLLLRLMLFICLSDHISPSAGYLFPVMFAAFSLSWVVGAVGISKNLLS